MKLSRRRFLHLAAGVAALPMAPHIASAQTYPVRPVRILVGFAPGGPVDIFARLMAQWMSERLGQPFVVENRPGDNTNVATEAVVRAPADGYTLFLASNANANNATLYDKLNFNFIRDIAPVASIVRQPQIMLVNPSFPAKTVPELIAYAKTNPSKIRMASTGNGTRPHLAGELFKMMTGVTMIHVPYSGGAPALTDLIGGQVQVMFLGPIEVLEHIKTGRLRALAVSTTKRLDVLPDLPTVADFVPGYESSGWFGIGAPRNTPREIVGKINSEVNSALADAKIKARLADLGTTVLGGSPDDFAALIMDETEKWAKVIKFAGIKPQ